MTRVGRPSPMDDADNRMMLAELYAAGATRDQMSDVFGVHVDTITIWTRRPDVQALITELRQQRANRILRTVDSEIAGRLENEEARKKLDLKDLLAIKREYTPQRVEVGRAGDFDEAAQVAAWDQLDRGEEPLALPAGDVEEEFDDGE